MRAIFRFISMNNIYNQYQFDDLKGKGEDLYASTKYAIIRDALAKQGKMRILNAGCGSGDLSFLLAQDGHRVHGIDPSEEYIALARGHGAFNRISFMVSSIEDFESDELFDAVVATDVLEHIKDDSAALEKLARLARPGGLVIIAVPALSWLYGYHDRMLGHFRRYSKSSLKCLVRNIGDLRIERFRYFGFMLIPISFLYSVFLTKPYPVAPSGGVIDDRMRQMVLRPILAFERLVAMPAGTSIIGIFRKR